MIKTTLKWLFYLVASFYTADAGFKLMTYPNDLTFIAGIIMVLLTAVFWADMLYLAVTKLLKEKNEKAVD